VNLPHFLNASGRTFGAAEEQLVLEALRSGCLSRNGGTMVKRLENDFAKALGVPYCVACSHGTASVHLCIAALDLEPADEVIVPPVTDIGSIMPILWQNAIPVFADLDPETLVLDPEDVRRKVTGRTRAIVAVHLAGQPCDMHALMAIGREHGVAVIEDCSQAYWAEFDGRKVGTLGDMACFSLQQSKHITCGEGGLMVTANSRFAERALLFSDKAWPRGNGGLGSCRFLFLSQNYRMSELQGAVALGQLPRVADVVACRRARAEQLTALIAGIPQVSAPRVPANTRHSYWLYMLRSPEARRIGDAMVERGVPAWVEYIIDPLYLSPMFTGPATYGTSGYPLATMARQEYRRGLCPAAEEALHRTIAIHWNENYTEEHVAFIAETIRAVV